MTVKLCLKFEVIVLSEIAIKMCLEEICLFLNGLFIEIWPYQYPFKLIFQINVIKISLT